MTNQLFLEKLKQIDKSYFSLSDLKKIYPGKKKNLEVVLHRLVKQKRIERLSRGYYSLNLSSVDWEALACQILKPSYISLEYALHYWGIIDQIPARITSITTKKKREYRFKNNLFEYSRISPKLYFGYKIEGNILIAEKEKALLDELYLISLKKRSLALKSLDLSKINKPLFNKWLKKFPAYVMKKAREIGI